MRHTTFSSILCAVSCVVLLASQTGDVFAQYSPEDYDCAKIDTCHYDRFNVVCTPGASIAVSSAGTDKATNGSWSSGLQPPYILEQFAIETLKNVAQKKGTNVADAVTEEHVIALVAFMWGEGGDIMNQDIFNPLNTGINAPELLASANAANGLQSFKSFDAGVEATARTMVGSYQSRLAAVLTQKDSTAQQFMEALTYFNRYEGNKFWAEASLPPNDAKYYAGRLQLVQQTRAKYADMAGTILGTPQKEAALNLTDKSKLTFHPTTDTSSSSGSSGASTGGTTGQDCATTVAGGVVAGNIAKTALGLAWPEPHPPPLEPKPEYIAAMQQFNPGALGLSGGADCGAFVGTVMKASGADKDYPASFTGAQLAYATAHPEKYLVTQQVSSTADLQPGDIMIVGGVGGVNASGHTYIFVGLQSNGYDEASASLGTRMPSLHKAVTSDARGNYVRIRLINAATN